MSPELKKQFALQRKIVFGNKRYWFHIVIWSVVICLGIFGISEISKGSASGTETEKTAKDKKREIGITQVDLTAKNGKNAIKTVGKKSSLQHDIFTTDQPFKSMATGILIASVVVYFFLLVAVPYAYYKRRKFFLLLGLLLSVAFYFAWLLLAVIVAKVIKHDSHQGLEQQLTIFFGSIGIVSLMLTFTVINFFSLYYFIDLYDQQKNLNRYQQVFTEKLIAETNFLKLQINPHFLFNTLNNIYSLSLQHSSDTAVIAQRLKELMQYMLTDCAQPMVPLQGEIDFFINYVTLEKLRTKQNNININLTVVGDASHKHIAPLLLINFIENAFKHGVKSSISAAFINILLTIKKEQLLLEISNSKPVQTVDPKLAITETSGIGLNNVKRRLQILYAGKHKLKIKETKTEYAVLLTITF
jgi:two-component system LytT family sensor kinase